MKISLINGSPKSSGFTHEILDIAGDRLREKDVQVNFINLGETNIRDCIGCFNCLKTGHCVMEDDLETIIDVMLESDGFVVGSPVRNGLITACYKRFIERITYILGFTLALENKYTMGIASVGFLGGKSVSKKFCCLQGIFHTHLSSFIFSSVGIPATKSSMKKMESRVLSGVDKLISDVSSRKPRPRIDGLSFSIERAIMRKFLFQKNPDVYRNVIKKWQFKGYM